MDGALLGELCRFDSLPSEGSGWYSLGRRHLYFSRVVRVSITLLKLQTSHSVAEHPVSVAEHPAETQTVIDPVLAPVMNLPQLSDFMHKRPA